MKKYKLLIAWTNDEDYITEPDLHISLWKIDKEAVEEAVLDFLDDMYEQIEEQEGEI